MPRAPAPTDEIVTSTPDTSRAMTVSGTVRLDARGPLQDAVGHDLLSHKHCGRAQQQSETQGDRDGGSR